MSPDAPAKEAETAEAPWHAAFPSPRTVAVSAVTRDELLQWLQQGRSDFALVDLRRMDCEGGMIRGSINLPAQSLYHTIPALYKLFKAAGLTKVIFFCGSSRGRGTRAAGWFADHLEEEHEPSLQSFILQGGIKAWAAGGDQFVRLMDGYREEAWQ